MKPVVRCTTTFKDLGSVLFTLSNDHNNSNQVSTDTNHQGAARDTSRGFEK